MPDVQTDPETDAPTCRGMLIRALPIIATYYLAAILQFTDAAMVSVLGSSSLAALGPAAFMLVIPATFGFGLVTSVNTCVAQAYTRKSRIRERCARFGIQGVWLGLIFGVLSLSLLPASRVIVGVLGYEEQLAAGINSYFELSLFAIPFQVATAALGGYFVGIHRARLVLHGAIIGTLANIVLNYLFIFGNFGLPELGLKGAALGTVCASAIHFAYALSRFRSGLSAWQRMRLSWQPRRRTLARLSRLGLPLGVLLGIDILSWGFVIFLIGYFGEAHLAAATVVVRCIHLSFLPAEGVGIALSNAISQAIGEGRAALAELHVANAFKIMAIYMTGMGLCLFLFRHLILGAFSNDPLVVEIGVHAMIFAAASQFFDALGITYYSALLGTGDNAWPMRVTLGATIGLLGAGGLALIYFLPGAGSLGIWFLDAVYVAILGFAFRMRWRSGYWRKIDIFKN